MPVILRARSRSGGTGLGWPECGLRRMGDDDGRSIPFGVNSSMGVADSIGMMLRGVREFGLRCLVA